MSDPVLEVPFTEGIDESQQPEIIQPSGFIALENVRFTRTGSVEKRPGFETLASTVLGEDDRASGRRLFANGEQICVIDGTNVSTYSEELGTSVLRGRIPEASYRLREAPSVGMAQLTAGAITKDPGDLVTVSGGSGNFIAIAWRASDGSTVEYAMAALLDAYSGATISGPTSLAFSDGMTIALASYGALVVAVCFDADFGVVKLFRLDTTNATTIANGWVSAGTIASDYLQGGRAVGTGDAVAIGYVNNSGGTSQVTVLLVTGGAVLRNARLDTGSATPSERGLAMGVGGSKLWVSWNESTDIRVCALTALTLGVVGTTSTVITLTGAALRGIEVCGRSDGNAAVFANNGDLVTYSVQATVTAGAAAADGSVKTFGNGVIRGGPFEYGGRVYAHFTTTNTEEIILCDCTPDTSSEPSGAIYLRPVAVPIMRGLFGSIGATTPALETTKFVAHLVVKKSGTTFGSTIVEYDFANDQRWRPASLNTSTILGGGVTTIFDGVRPIEAGFLCAPSPIGIVSTATAGALTLAAPGRRYVATYEEVDADGNWHVSGVSIPSDASGAVTTKKIQISGAPISITMRGSLANTAYTSSDVVGSLRTRVWATSETGEAPYYSLVEIANDPTTTQWTYDDEIADATLTAKALLYGTGNLPGTNGAAQDRRAPPGLLHVLAYNGMLVGATGKSFFYSGQPIDGEGTWFSSAFSFVLEDDVTGLAVQDGTVLIFSERGVWTTAGDPPSDNGASGGLSTPRRLSVNNGCTNANSIVSTASGVFYQSPRGVELMTRGGSSVLVGSMFQGTLEAFPYISAATLDDVNGLVRFALATSSTDSVVSSSGRWAVFDLTREVWSIDITEDEANSAAQDACIVSLDGQRRYAWLDRDGVVHVERVDGSSLDGSTWVTMRALSPWLHIAGLSGEQFLDQVLFLGRASTQHDVTISVGYEYVETYADAVTFPSDAAARMRLVKGLAQTTSSAIQVQITDAAPSAVGATVGTGKGGTWIGYTLNGQPHRGPRRSTATQRGGS